MAGLTTAEAQLILDSSVGFPTSGGTDYIAYSANGSSETASLARTAIGATGWAAASAADPSVKQNQNALTSATATGAVTVTHFAVYSAVTAGRQRTDWQAVTSSKTLAIGDTVTWAAGALQITLT
jgi:hypothetical protein